jgi:hypothetical protein
LRRSVVDGPGCAAASSAEQGHDIEHTGSVIGRGAEQQCNFERHQLGSHPRRCQRGRQHERRGTAVAPNTVRSLQRRRSG